MQLSNCNEPATLQTALQQLSKYFQTYTSNTVHDDEELFKKFGEAIYKLSKGKTVYCYIILTDGGRMQDSVIAKTETDLNNFASIVDQFSAAARGYKFKGFVGGDKWCGGEDGQPDEEGFIIEADFDRRKYY